MATEFMATEEYFGDPGYVSSPPDVRAGIWSTESINKLFSSMIPSSVPLTTSNAPFALNNFLKENSTLLIGVGGVLLVLAMMKRR